MEKHDVVNSALVVEWEKDKLVAFVPTGVDNDTWNEEVEKDFVNGDLHPGDVKPALARHINVILQPVRDHFVNDPEAKKLLDTIKKYKVTK